MINFRYHLVSLTAIFLALALGILMGATVVGRGVVSALEDQLNRVGSRADAVADTNNRLEDELSGWARFAEQAGDQLVTGRLADVPVVMVSFAGVDRDVRRQLEASVRAAGASVPARITLTARFELGDEGAATELAGIIEAGSTVPAQVRDEAMRRLAEAWAGRARPDLMADLIGADFLEVTVEPESGEVPSLAELAPRFLVVSSDDTNLANESVAAPLVSAMSELALPVVAADTTVATGVQGPPAAPETEAPFVELLRDSDQVRGRISTVDGAAGFQGRIAVILALDLLDEDRVGQFGTAPGAERLLPD